MYTILCLILVSTFLVFYLGEKGVISSSPLMPLIGLLLISLWILTYTRINQLVGLFDILGLLLSFTRSARPRLFSIMITVMYAMAGALLYGSLAALFAL